jgi:hypothetical protein
LERSTSFEAIVLEALLFCAHDADLGDSVHVGKITQLVNTILMGRGATREVDPRKVGHVLRTLGFSPRRLDSAGRGILLVQEVRQTVHDLAWDLAVPSVRDGVAHCDYCKRLADQYASQKD